MAAINFVKGEQYYTAEFQINGPVNIHIERAEAGALYFRQRSIDHGSYDLINGANWNNRGDLTIDTAIQGVVYPMWIKIESASEPTLAEMVEGEQSGGGAGTAESTMEYLDVSGLDGESQEYLKNVIVVLANMVKSQNDEGTFLGAPLSGIQIMFGTTNNNARTVIAVAIDFSQFVKAKIGNDVLELSLNQLILRSVEGITQLDLDAIPRITKEQFYSLEA